MNREQFLKQLSKYLRKLPKEEYDNAMEYYSEYLNDVEPEKEMQVIENLGSPYKIASQIIAETAVRDMQTSPSIKKGLSTAWVVILAIFASPIALPFGCVLAALGLAIIVTIASFLLAFACIAIGFTLGGFAMFIMGFCVIFQHLPTAIYNIGSGLFLFGAGIFVGIFTIWLSKVCLNGLTKLVAKCLPRRNAQ